VREPISIIGGGLAGTEAAWQIARRGLRAVLYEMRPARSTAAHQTDRLAELVCSNSLKSESEWTAPWLLKEELRRLDSLLLAAAQKARVPGGHALTVDREGFSAGVTAAIESEPLIEVRREEVTVIPEDGIAIVATGPLTSDALAREISRLTGSDRLYFYDSISPIVDAETVDTNVAFWASRYGKSTDGTDDYLNCPLDREQYERFVDELLKGQSVPAHIAEDETPYFEACLPIEELARRGRDTLRFGPMKPVGLSDPRTGRRPWAVVQLRQENLRARSFNLVGFQNHLRFGEQARILRMIPGLDFVDLAQPRVGYMCNTLNALPAFKREVHRTQLQAAADAGVTTLAGIYHACHRELCSHERDWPFEVVNFLELVGESMGLTRPDLFKRLKLMQDVDAVLADAAPMIATHHLDLDEARAVVLHDMLGGQPLPLMP